MNYPPYPLPRASWWRRAKPMARWREAGAALMGKSNPPELAGATHCWSPLFGLAAVSGTCWLSGCWPGRTGCR